MDASIGPLMVSTSSFRTCIDTIHSSLFYSRIQIHIFVLSNSVTYKILSLGFLTFCMIHWIEIRTSERVAIEHS